MSDTPKSRVLALLSANSGDVVRRLDLIKALDERPLRLFNQAIRYARLFRVIDELIADGHDIEADRPDGVRLISLAEVEA